MTNIIIFLTYFAYNIKLKLPAKVYHGGLEGAIRRFKSLLFYIFNDYFVSHIARACHKVASCPHMATQSGATREIE